VFVTSAEMHNNGEKLKSVKWPTDDDNGDYYRSTVTVFRLGAEYWALGTTSLFSEEFAKLDGVPDFKDLKPDESCGVLGGFDENVFGDFVEEFTSCSLVPGTYEHRHC